MAGWFYLGTSSAREQHHHLSKDESHRPDEIYRHGGATTKGLELWPQCYEADNHFAGGSSEDSGRRVNLIDFSDECWRSGVTSAMRPGGGGGGTSGVGVGGTNCQDCGNQAKKDCPHIRCRTCCKSRGFQCSTHLKSTWVPAAKRRERQQQQQQQIAGMQQPFRISENPKRPRQEHGHPHHHQQQQQLVAARSSGDLGLEVGQHYPPEVNSPAVFRCVRVTGVDDTDEEFAYQTSVNIAGHVFKGILYDQGPEEGSGGGGVARNYSAAGGGGESSGAAHHHHQQFSLMAATAAATSGSNPSAMIDPSLFPAPLNAFMAGTQFFPPPRS